MLHGGHGGHQAVRVARLDRDAGRQVAGLRPPYPSDPNPTSIDVVQVDDTAFVPTDKPVTTGHHAMQGTSSVRLNAWLSTSVDPDRYAYQSMKDSKVRASRVGSVNGFVLSWQQLVSALGASTNGTSAKARMIAAAVTPPAASPDYFESPAEQTQMMDWCGSGYCWGTETAATPEPGEELARATGIDVVYDFGSADREAGGQGGPLEPVYHRALAEAAGLARPLAVVELGDGATITFIGEDGSLAVFRAGPSVTAEAIADIRPSLPAPPLLWLLAGEEAKRASLLEALSGIFPEPVHRAEEMGWSIEHFEAEAFAYLAVRSIRKLPLTFPGTTGVKAPVTGGRLARAPRR